MNEWWLFSLPQGPTGAGAWGSACALGRPDAPLVPRAVLGPGASGVGRDSRAAIACAQAALRLAVLDFVLLYKYGRGRQLVNVSLM